MSLSNFSCVVCCQNFHYLNDSSSWLRRFRILYSSPTGISVSGVGLFDGSYESVCAVPLGYAARWDDPGCRFIEIVVMNNRPIKKCHGFIFHEACWELLEKTHHPQAVPYSRLYEICKSIPFIRTMRGSCLNLCHDYDGLGLEDNEDCFPFEDRFPGRTPHSSQFQLSDRNPLYFPEVEQLLKKRPHSIPTIWKHHRTRQARHYANIFSKSPFEEDALSEIPLNADTFSRLPMEIRDMIACLLSTSDFWNLRLASKAFFPTFSNQLFWATKFSQHSDRGWLFELWNCPEHKDWRWLYRCTNDTNLMPALQNRKRIWKLAERLRDLASLQWKGPSRPYTSHKETSGLSYRETAGHLIEFYRDFHEGCRLLRRQYVSIPQSLSQIAFSTVRVGDTEYISGMRLVSSEGAVRKLGYWSERKVYFANITSLRVVHVAVGSRGIQAIQVVTDEHTSQWLGSPTKCPKTRYLAVSKPIKTIKAGYDGCKMVSLGVEFEDVSAIDQPIKEMKSLRDIGLWDPEAPGPNLFLNEYPFLVNGYSPTKYRPLAWISFGGPGGVYLRSLTGIVVTLGRLDSPNPLHFTYDTKAIPKQSGKPGGCNRPYYGRRVHFPIDGSGGEIIEAVEIILQSATVRSNSGEPGSLMGFKISTNRGRHCSFPPPPPPLPPPPAAFYELSQVEMKAISIAPGTTITGFYVSMHPQWGLKSLGVISEVIENKTGEKSVS